MTIDKRVFYNSAPWRRKRKEILKRDNYECQWCKLDGRVTIDTGEKNRNGRKKNALIVHHIQELLHRPDLRLEDDNLVTVCFRCHETHHGRWQENKKNKWKNDEQW